jgi:DNA (cytosine-5)-methyltransferase 1
MLFKELIVDNFAGGGGASTGIELATGRQVDIAINHDPDAIAMHKMNHPDSKHFCESVWDVDPVKAVNGLPVGLAWFSPDCKHFSKAKGKTPVNKFIRGLAWITAKCAALASPRVMMLENVEEFKTWGPVIDGKPCEVRKGETFDGFNLVLSTGLPLNHPAWSDVYSALFRCNFDLPYKLSMFKKFKKGLGYQVEWKELRACDFGAPTIRKRLFMVARRDGNPIVWPKPTHTAIGGKLPKYKSAADIIDWSIPCKSIFNRPRPLAENTLKRIAKGLERYVFKGNPFIAPAEATIVPFITEHANARSQRNMPANEPLRTICAQVKGGHFAVVSPYIVKCNHGGSETFRGQSSIEPLQTVTAKNGYAIVAPMLVGSGGPKYSAKPRSVETPINTLPATNHSALVTAFLAKHYTGVVGDSLENPLPTVTTIDHNALVTSHMIKLRNGCNGISVNEPIHTITSGGGHIGEVRSFLLKYYGSSVGVDCKEPLHTVTTKHRFGLVTVAGEEYQIVDIGMRMLEPRELFNASGFPEEYIINVDELGNKVSKAKQVARVGNAVPPPFAKALVEANLPEMCFNSINQVA